MAIKFEVSIRRTGQTAFYWLSSLTVRAPEDCSGAFGERPRTLLKAPKSSGDYPASASSSTVQCSCNNTAGVDVLNLKIASIEF